MDDFLKELEELNATSALRNDYTKTLALLRAMKAGKVSLEQVTMTADGWQVSTAVEVPAIPVEEEKETGEPEPGEPEPAEPEPAE